MRLITIIIILCLAVLATAIFFILNKEKSNQTNMPKTNQQKTEKNIRPPAVAGQFYPGDKKELEKMIDNYLSAATPEKSAGVPQIIIVPHAGYVYSGKVAAYGFKAVQNTDFKRVIILGRSHREFFSGLAADDHDIWATPLGDLAVDHDFIKALVATNSGVKIDAGPHQEEHSLEAMLPFLIKTMGKDIKTVPLLFGDENPADSAKLAEALAKLIDRQTLIVISTDLSHYPAYNDAQIEDKKTIEAILTMDINKFYNRADRLADLEVSNFETLACAEPAVATAIILAKSLGFQPHLLRYASSGDAFPSQKNQVVGYAAISFNNLKINDLPENSLTTMPDQRELNPDEQKLALKIARQTLEAAFARRDYKPETDNYPVFRLKRGVFVTLKKDGQLRGLPRDESERVLRGCIGTFEPNQNLADTIQAMALAAAFNDPRFMPLTENELKEVEIEISVLSPRQKISNHSLIEIGKHGVYVQKGSQSGVYLPQVATEQNWTREQFLDSLCEQKSGLGKDCWRDGSVDLYIFTAQIFEE